MITSTTIKRLSGNDQLGFDELKSQGLEWVQELSGRLWSDYNLHDPGVTILEQLCYGLTDMVYRAEFSVADLLSDQHGQIDYEKLALYTPEEILPCRPTTVDDFRKVIFDRLPELDDLWLQPVVPANGLYTITVRLKNRESAFRLDEIKEQVDKVFQAHRNLGEDLAEVRIPREALVELNCEVEIQGARKPEEIAAEIFLNCARAIAGGITLHQLDKEELADHSLEEIFTGPRTEHGLILDQDLPCSNRQVTISEIFPKIKGVTGVKHIRELSFLEDGETYYDTVGAEDDDRLPRLSLPETEQQLKVRLVKGDKYLPLNLQKLRAILGELDFSHHALRHTEQDLTMLYELPKGNSRAEGGYVSIQEQFPNIYGINSFGVPSSYPDHAKARAAQLKAYLLLFEQVLANNQASVAGLPDLFSLESRQPYSQYTQVLDNTVVPDVDKLYQRPPAETLERILKKYDRFPERKNRVLDYLLALYGEKFSQNTLRHFNFYYTPEEMEEACLANKCQMLKNMVRIGRDRGAGFNQSQAAWNTDNIAGLKRKSSLLLGFKYSENRSLTIGILKQGLKLVPDRVFQEMDEGILDLQLVDLSDIPSHLRQSFQRIPLDQRIKQQEMAEVRGGASRLTPLKHNLLPGSLLRHGIDLANYRLGSLTNDGYSQLVFRPAGDNHWWYLSSFRKKVSGRRAANALRRFLIHLNIESEGLHLVEHILLRPMDPEGDGFSEIDDSFYSFRISVLFPLWTARCHDPNFQQLAEETVRLNCPAHIHPTFYWLEFKEMYEFEVLYKQWLDLKFEAKGREARLDRASLALISFLHEAAATTETHGVPNQDQ